MRFVIGLNLACKPVWWLVDEDDRVLAWAGRAFASLAYADQAAHDYRVNADDPEYRVQARASGVWRWTSWRPGGTRVAISGDWYPSERAAREAAERVQLLAGTALGP